MLHELIQHWIITWFGWVQNGGYLGIIALMAMESSIFPVPSEVVIPPAAYLAMQPDSHMNFWGVIVAGTFGSWLGAVVTYWISRWVGRIVIVKWGRLFFVSESKLERSEIWLRRYEAGGIFFARLLPVIRHLISIPAGIIRMNFGVFSAMTVLGSLIWCTVLAWFGQKVIKPEMFGNPATMVSAIKAQSHWIILAVLVLCVLYFVVIRLTAKPQNPSV
jgi:membrane protein DedA with SNARE-associated domain